MVENLVNSSTCQLVTFLNNIKYENSNYRQLRLIHIQPQPSGKRVRSKELEEFDKILLSPGPGIPEEAGLLLDVIRTYSGRKPILGVCLGEQAIGEVFGGKLVNLKEVYHGIQSKIRITADDYIFNGLPEEIAVGRYHSWVVDKETLPACLEITAVSAEGYIMAIRHKDYDVRGIQFHPESVLTPDGKKMIENWIFMN